MLKLKIAFPILFVLFISFTAYGEDLPEKVQATLKKLYPNPGSLSYTLYGDFYDIGYHDVQGTGGIINLIIDKEGVFIGTKTGDYFGKEKCAEVKTLLDMDCASPKVTTIKTPDDKSLYYAYCYQADDKGEQTTVKIATYEGKVLYEGSREVVY